MSKENKPIEVREFPLPKVKNIKAMSVEELQASGQFEGWSEEDLTLLLKTIKAFTEIVYATWTNQEAFLQKTFTIPLYQEKPKAA